MRILLINPPRFNELIGKNPALVENHRGYNPPLGILSLAGYLKRHSEHQVEILDAQPTELTYTELAEYLRHTSPDVVGITAMTFTLIDVIRTVRLVKEFHPHTKVVLGGPHVHIYPNETMALPGVDFLVQGEGEIAFLNMLDHLEDLDALEKVGGVVFKRGDEIINTGIAPATENLDELGLPARELVDVKKYTSLLGRDNVITTMFTSRGCPYRCTFCDRPYSPVISGFRYRSAKHVADEMEQCVEMGIHEAFIYDDTFTVKKDRVFELCDEIKKRKLKFRWDVRAHVNTVTPDMLKAMSDSGCDRIHYGVESGNDRMMKIIRKNCTVEKVKDAVQWTKDANMEVLAYFIMGQQSETREDIADSIRLAKELDPNYVHFTIFCPYPATEIYMQGLSEGIIKEDIWRNFARDPQPGFELPVWEENFTRQELRELLVKCYKEFYLRPGYIIKNIGRIRSAGEFKRKMKAGLSVLGMRPDDKLKPEDVKRTVRQVVPSASYEVHL